MPGGHGYEVGAEADGTADQRDAAVEGPKLEEQARARAERLANSFTSHSAGSELTVNLVSPFFQSLLSHDIGSPCPYLDCYEDNDGHEDESVSLPVHLRQASPRRLGRSAGATAVRCGEE